MARPLSSCLYGKEEIEQRYRVAWDSGAAVEAAAAAAIRDLKRQFSNRFRLAISAAADRLVKQVRADDLDGIAFGILVDRLLLLGGELTARVEAVEDPAAVAFGYGLAALAGRAAVTGAPGMG